MAPRIRVINLDQFAECLPSLFHEIKKKVFVHLIDDGRQPDGAAIVPNQAVEHPPAALIEDLEKGLGIGPRLGESIRGGRHVVIPLLEFSQNIEG